MLTLRFLVSHWLDERVEMFKFSIGEIAGFKKTQFLYMSAIIKLIIMFKVALWVRIEKAHRVMHG